MVMLYHGSDVAIEAPDVSRNTGYADLGRGFYVTDDRDAAVGRAASRARALGAERGFVSAYDFDEAGLAWLAVPSGAGASMVEPGMPFGLAFSLDERGIEEWLGYIVRCRKGDTVVPDLGEPAVVRGWIATMEVEMVNTGLIEPAELACLVERDKLIVQYCFCDQDVVDRLLRFVSQDEVAVEEGSGS